MCTWKRDSCNNNFGNQGAAFFLSHLFSLLQKIFAIDQTRECFYCASTYISAAASDSNPHTSPIFCFIFFPLFSAAYRKIENAIGYGSTIERSLFYLHGYSMNIKRQNYSPVMQSIFDAISDVLSSSTPILDLVLSTVAAKQIEWH